MAFLREKYCIKCNIKFRTTNELTCSNCLNEEADKKRKKHFDALDKLSFDQRVRNIEEWMYDYKPNTNNFNEKY